MGMVSFRSLRLMLPLIAAAVLLVAAGAHAQNASTSKFDHNPTGFSLTGTHAYIPCASCHINARFKNTPTACFGCHNGMTAPGATSLLNAHPKTTNYCEGCHQTTTWRDYRFIDHVQALAPCASCHNGKIAQGKGRGHPVTEATCNTCHFNTVTWGGGILPAATPQAAAAATTANAAAAKATPSPATGPSPQAGSQTSPGMRSASAKPDHATFIANCVKCHNGAAAPGRPAKHIATSAPCETCHKSTRTFAGARVDHRSLTGSCISCHNGTTAEGRPPRHILTVLPCDTCHQTRFWSPVTKYQHTSPAYVNHGPGIECASCHAGNSQAVAWKFPAYRMTCAGCHADKFRPMAHLKFEHPAKVYYTVSDLRDCAASCHTYADGTQRSVVVRSFSRHRAFGGGW
jgi:Cytochrome c7 and related cytochrome c